MHIEISKTHDGFEVRVIDSEGRALRRFTYTTIERARVAAVAWAAAYDNCQIKDLTR